MALKTTARKKEDHAESASELAHNLKMLIEDAERLLVETASEKVDDTIDELREHLQEKIDHLRSAYEAVEGRVLSTMTVTEKQVRKHPYESVGIALGIGVVIGLLLRK